jgi:hypothetical protein
METAVDVHHVEVQVVTTSGTFPEHGTDRNSINQPVRVVLDRAQKKLDITNASDWLATVGGHEIDPAKSYAANHLSGQVKIDWGPREGGGGKGMQPNA